MTQDNLQIKDILEQNTLNVIFYEILLQRQHFYKKYYQNGIFQYSILTLICFTPGLQSPDKLLCQKIPL